MFKSHFYCIYYLLYLQTFIIFKVYFEKLIFVDCRIVFHLKTIFINLFIYSILIWKLSSSNCKQLKRSFLAVLVPLKDFGHHWHVWVPNATATKRTEVSVWKMLIWILNVKSSNISVIVSCRLYKSSSGEKDSQKSRSTVEKAATDMSSNYNALIKVSIMISILDLDM